MTVAGFVPATQPIAIPQGDDYTLVFVYTSGLVLGGWAQFTILSRGGDPGTLATYSSDDDTLDVDTDTLSVSIPLARATTAAWSTGDYYYRLQVSSDSGARHTTHVGNFAVEGYPSL